MIKINFILLALLFSLISTAKGQKLDSFWKESEVFFQTYVQQNYVHYQQLKKEPSDIHSLVKQIASISLATADSIEQKAFYINAYNLLVIDNIVQYFPIASPNEILEFWDAIEYQIAGKNYTLKEFKYFILQKYSDPRLHFVLVDGMVGSPPIADVAYQPNLLEQQLENKSIEVLNSLKFVSYNTLNRELVLSALFKEYSNDFQPTVLDFINRYRVQKISPSLVKYANKDCLLNYYYGSVDYEINIKKNKTNPNKFSALTTTIPKNAVELQLFSSIFTATSGDKISGTRNSYLNGLFSAYYGITGTLDIGMSFVVRSSRENDHYSNSPFKTFEFERTSLDTNSNKRVSRLYSDWGFSHLGVQIRFAPFKKLNFTFEQIILFPIKGLPLGNTVDESINIVSQIYYTHPFNSKLHLFLALTFWQPVQPGKAFNFQPPMLRGFLNYFATPRLTLFAQTMYLVEWGVGVKFLIGPQLEIQAMYSYFLPIPELLNVFSGGTTSIMTYNLGLRYRI